MTLFSTFLAIGLENTYFWPNIPLLKIDSLFYNHKTQLKKRRLNGQKWFCSLSEIGRLPNIFITLLQWVKMLQNSHETVSNRGERL